MVSFSNMELSNYPLSTVIIYKNTIMFSSCIENGATFYLRFVVAKEWGANIHCFNNSAIFLHPAGT
jgi:hypothetical protein